MEALEARMGAPEIFDLAVIGGGPAGTAAAITAARAGARVLLLERGQLPRQRVCGEFVSAESLTLLAGLLGSTASTLVAGAVRIPKARLFFDGHVVPAEIKPAAASIARFDLDFALWGAAQRAGADARPEISIENIMPGADFRLRTRDCEYRSRSVIDASGRWSNLRLRAFPAMQPSQEKWLGVKAHFIEPNPNPSVDLYFFEGGYCGVQPVKLSGSGEARINACAMVRSDVARCLPDVFAQHPALSARASGWTAVTEPVTTSPLIFREPEPEKDGIFSVGDAAGFVDPFVGDGISLALRSGTLAAECLLPFFRSQIPLSEAASRYRAAYRRRLLPVFRNSSRFRRLLRLPAAVRSSLACLLELSPMTSRLIVRMTR